MPRGIVANRANRKWWTVVVMVELNGCSPPVLDFYTVHTKAEDAYEAEMNASEALSVKGEASITAVFKGKLENSIVSFDAKEIEA